MIVRIPPLLRKPSEHIASDSDCYFTAKIQTMVQVHQKSGLMNQQLWPLDDLTSDATFRRISLKANLSCTDVTLEEKCSMSSDDGTPPGLLFRRVVTAFASEDKP